MIFIAATAHMPRRRSLLGGTNTIPSRDDSTVQVLVTERLTKQMRHDLPIEFIADDSSQTGSVANG
jgi:hypothetical protein